MYKISEVENESYVQNANFLYFKIFIIVAKEKCLLSTI